MWNKLKYRRCVACMSLPSSKTFTL